MNFASIDAIRKSGFKGFVTISALRTSKCCKVPAEHGVYFILKTDSERPDFLSKNVARRPRGKKTPRCSSAGVFPTDGWG
jgi:hypothetical protein